MCSLEKRNNVFILRLNGEGEHRFNPQFMDSIISALTHVNSNAHNASALLTTNDGKYFSNGLDLQWASHDKENRSRAMSRKFLELITVVMDLKLPSIAAVCGHACAGGFIFALAHDYRFMRKDRGFLYMSEVDVGMTIPPTAMAIIGSKVDPFLLTEVVLGGRKYTADEALKKGLVDSIYNNSDETLAAALNFAGEIRERKWNGDVYRGLKFGVFPEAAEKLGLRSGYTLPSRL